MIVMVRNKLIYKYLVVGISTVLLDYSFVFLFYSILKIHYILSVLMGFIASNIFQFYINFFYTFKLEKNDNFYERALIFIIAVLIGNLIGLVSIVLIKFVIVNLYIAKTLSLPISFLYGYFVSKNFIYNKNFRLIKCKIKRGNK